MIGWPTRALPKLLIMVFLLSDLLYQIKRISLTVILPMHRPPWRERQLETNIALATQKNGLPKMPGTLMSSTAITESSIGHILGSSLGCSK